MTLYPSRQTKRSGSSSLQQSILQNILGLYKFPVGLLDRPKIQKRLQFALANLKTL